MLFYIYQANQKNTDVTKKYISIIRAALKKRGHECIDVTNISHLEVGHNIGIVTIDAFHAIEANMKLYNPIIYWVQGALPEESYLRRKSVIRRNILSIIEKKALLCADYLLYVSKAMKEHYRSKYGIEKEAVYIMPCFSEEIDNLKPIEGQHKENLFLYAGRLSVWQCFEKTVQLYQQIEKRYSTTSFLVMTHQVEEAKKIICKYDLRNYYIDYAEGDEFIKRIAKCKFGFCLREDNIVNRIATPTKYSDYISNNIIPIYSKSTKSFFEKARRNPYCLCLEDSDFWNKLDYLCNTNIDVNDIQKSYRETFENYYSSSYHIEALTKSLLDVGI